MITGKNYIGQTPKASGDKTYKTVNPKLNIENNTAFIDATEDEIDEAVNLAWDAFKIYRKVSGVKRAEFLNAIADEILVLDQTLIDMYMLESGLPEGRAIGERGRTIFQLRSFAELILDEQWRDNSFDAADPERKPLPKVDLRRTSIPLGPVVVLGASNFPLAFSTAGGDVSSALAAGCPVIVKSHPMHSGTGELVAKALLKAAKDTGMPNGVFSNLNGKSIEVGTALVKHPKVKAVGFTGSVRGGRALFDLASKRKEPIPVFAEMGSINPVVITPKAIEKHSEALATQYANSITLGTGQFCTNPGLLLTIDNENTQKFIDDLAQKTVTIEAQCMLHPNIKEGFMQNSLKVSSQRGVEIIAKIESEVAPNYAPSQIVSVSGKDFLENPKLQQEVFGPFSLVVKAKNETELIKIIESLEGQLTGTIIAEKDEYSGLHDIVDALVNRVGRIIFNGVPTGVEVCSSMQHGGPYPASTDSRFTAVGTNSIKRWVRPVSYQSFPKELLPEALK
ncbi:aldehyde dehydrogenase (NADP(+)) [Seonamhaeicola aphaedonensis]|uniref:NADP-dependent aldehyde dehydrogenase n=1 Tax=Seonamhaeicola aphaedonensis TaxID=1461338 RepID=A0A3D9HLN6_9FLAO|nr:aldehyde dehydrogenase (NADP(+)) [Seonamhaeicola aphaedonensis]RED50315.1 NADP-dependent aldehyde dehydrogenase [Seonamhaeicola aphaedonensis]